MDAPADEHYSEIRTELERDGAPIGSHDLFIAATQIGLTATPKETADVPNIDYFGEPVYTYSLRQGIEDEYLARYTVIRIDLDKNTFGWRSAAGMTDKLGDLIEDRMYTGADMNRSLVLE